jgi:hypothetical protein
MQRVRIAVLAIAGLGLAGIGLLHVPAVRRLGLGAEKCPRLGPGSALEDARKLAMKPLAGATKAPKEAAFGLVVGKDDRAAVKKWADSHAIVCNDVDSVALRCGRTTSLLGIGSDVFFRFDGDRLVGLDAIGIVPPAEGSSKPPFLALRETLTKTFGHAHDESEIASRWRFSDLAVDLSTFSVSDGARLRLQVRSIQ